MRTRAPARTMLALACSSALLALAPPDPLAAQDADVELPAVRPATPGVRPPATRPAEEAPAALQMIDRNAQEVYELVRDGRWERTRGPLSSLERAIRQVPVDMAGSADLAADLTGSLRNLEQAIALRDRTVAMRSANQITRTAAQMIERYQPEVPVEVRILAFHARQLQTDATERDRTMVDNSVREIRRTWQNLRPRVLERGEVVEVRRIDNLVERLDRTRTTRDYQRLGRSLEQEAERLAAAYGEPPALREPGSPAGSAVPERPQPSPGLELRRNVD